MVIWWTVQSLKTSRTFTCEFKATFRLPYSRQRWPNSIYLLSDDNLSAEQSLVLCGDRRGSLHVFKATSENEVRKFRFLSSKIGIRLKREMQSFSPMSTYSMCMCSSLPSTRQCTVPFDLNLVIKK